MQERGLGEFYDVLIIIRHHHHHFRQSMVIALRSVLNGSLLLCSDPLAQVGPFRTVVPTHSVPFHRCAGCANSVGWSGSFYQSPIWRMALNSPYQDRPPRRSLTSQAYRTGGWRAWNTPSSLLEFLPMVVRVDKPGFSGISNGRLGGLEYPIFPIRVSAYGRQCVQGRKPRARQKFFLAIRI